VRIINPWSLLLGLLLASPALAQAWSDPGADLTTPLLRFVLGTLVAGVGIALVSGLVELYRPQEQEPAATEEPVLEPALENAGADPLAA
jgi:hypothetical protein